MIRSRKVLNTAKGVECSMRLPGICRAGTETTVWAHLNGAAFGKGMGQKAHDILGMHACFWCHTAYDQNTHGFSDGEMNGYLLRAVCETYVRIVEAGVVIVPRDIEIPMMERSVKERKPKDQRKTIVSAKTEWPKRGFPKRTKF